MIDGYMVGILAFAGSLAGFLAGLLGIGGGLILVPFLSDVVLPHLNAPSQTTEHLARGTSMLVTFLASLSGAHRHHKRQCVIWKAVPFLALGSVLSAWAGAGLAAHLSGLVLRRVFAGVMILAAARMFLELKASSEHTETFNPIHLFVLGLVTGLVASLCGIGGGVVTVPALVLLLHFPMKKVAGTSSATIVFTGVSAALGYVYHGWGHPLLPSGTLGYVHWQLAIPLIVTGMIFSQLGAAANFRINPVPLRRVFGVLIGLAGIRMMMG